MKAILKNYRQSAQKVRLVVDEIRGKKASDALTILTFMPKRAAGQIKKVLESAIANAKENNGKEIESLFIKEVRVDEGLTMKRFRPRARGSAFPIRKRTSHIQITLGEKAGAAPVASEEVKTEAKPKKAAVKKAPAKKPAAKKTAATKKAAPKKASKKAARKK